MDVETKRLDGPCLHPDYNPFSMGNDCVIRCAQVDSQVKILPAVVSYWKLLDVTSV